MLPVFCVCFSLLRRGVQACGCLPAPALSPAWGQGSGQGGGEAPQLPQSWQAGFLLLRQSTGRGAAPTFSPADTLNTLQV